jgi:hypothetical protein
MGRMGMKIKGFLWGFLKGDWGIWDGVGGGRKLYYKNWGIWGISFGLFWD